MRWQCQYRNVKGVQCPSKAVLRLHFSASHPFDHFDVCETHVSEYKVYSWTQTLSQESPYAQGRTIFNDFDDDASVQRSTSEQTKEDEKDK